MNLPDCQTLLLAKQDGVLHITLNRPDSRNAMNLNMLEELIEVLTCASGDPQLRAIVLRGADGHFCAGGDIKDMANARAMGKSAYTQLNRHFGRLLEQAEQQPQVLVVVLEGTVLGGGLGLACVSDIALCLETARFGLPETSLGVIPAQIAHRRPTLAPKRCCWPAVSSRCIRCSTRRPRPSPSRSRAPKEQKAPRLLFRKERPAGLTTSWADQ